MVYFNWIHRSLAFILVISCFVICAQSDVPRPRGVSLSKASLYSPTKDFTCFDGTVTIPFSYVNDDYCDCFDGSDEPGTSACLNAAFHCTNAGHRPQNIPSSRVNDGVCDCCDGSDEYTAPVCGNTCAELGKEARAEALRVAELLKQGNQIRLQLIEKGNAKRNEMVEQLAQLEKDKSESESIKAEREALKDELVAKENEALKVYREAEENERQRKAEEEQQASRKEATEHFKRFDSNNDGQLTYAEIQTRNVFDKDKDGEVSEEEAKYFLNEEESVDYETFITVTWPLLKPFIMMEQGLFRPASENPEIEEPEHDVEHEEEETEGEEPLEDLETADDDLPREDDHQEITQTYDEETQKLVEQASQARSQLADAERMVREIEANINKIKQNLQKDYGRQQEFATLEDLCIEYEDKEYVYTLCMFQRITQRSKNGGSEVGLGVWGEWNGDEGVEYESMKYTNGMGCWNGPNRSTVVNIHCGLETKIVSVTEPSRCEYQMELDTPAACDHSRFNHATHDEL